MRTEQTGCGPVIRFLVAINLCRMEFEWRHHARHSRPPRHYNTTYATTFFQSPAKNKFSPLFSPPFSNIFRPPLSFRRNLFRSLIMTTNNFHYFMLSPLKLFSVKETIIGSKIHAIWHVLDTHHTNFTTSLWNSRPSTLYVEVCWLSVCLWPLPLLPLIRDIPNFPLIVTIRVTNH